MTDGTVKWAAELTQVREVSLLGTADLAFWKERLQKEELVPAERDGKAQLMVVAADSKYMGIRFAELSFSVLVSPRRNRFGRDAAFLVHAFNSCRFFAFCERALFATPYEHGDVRVTTSFPACIQLSKGGEVLFRAAMPSDAAAAARAPLRRGEESWEGPVFLPRNGRRKRRPGKLFIARLRGHTETYPFLNDVDSMMVRRAGGAAILQALIDSGFVGRLWSLRLNASHAKSKTYQRSDWNGQGP